MNHERKTIVSLLGPTGIGKSSLALELENKHPFEIVSVDSVMIYRDMNIGTDKPSNEILSSTKHHLIDIRNPNESYNVGQFYNDIGAIIKNVHNNNKVPLLVGGSMMYFNSLFNGLSLLPGKNLIEREFIDYLLLHYSCEDLHSCLEEIDPLSYENININDMQRIQRALEVYLCTGKPLTSFYNKRIKLSDKYNLLTFRLISDDRSLIHDKIFSRTKNMFDNHFIDEVIYILEKYSLVKENQSMRSIGYKQVLSYLHGDINKKDLEDKCIFATRQLAKRQITWLKQFNESIPIEIRENSFKNICKEIDNHLLF
ncbi:MAG: tRNA (adenosine(37)-N6)-dimethylallyltransferase MiaA [Gammaproteobacteria bacterium]|nr:tRNA (adenosine(37)-N6)-dimethylallyltransferase MiaA [Gammaproteobacteria bacterium]MDG2159333.1 tRNA (adenosine(37)-N6)-dimethylallyltransferase MiaA [Gammaproteobacteria bacterium]